MAALHLRRLGMNVVLIDRGSLIGRIRAGQMDRVEQLARLLRALYGPSLKRYPAVLGAATSGPTERTGRLYVRSKRRPPVDLVPYRPDRF